MDPYASAIAYIEDWINWASQELGSLISWLDGVFSFLWGFLSTLGNVLLSVGRFIWRAIQALLHAPFSSIWQKMKKVWDTYRRFRQWWQKNIQGPIDQMRRQILAIYRQFFKPIIEVIETLRVGVRIIAVFNRKLAAKLDAKFWALEGWILTPITRAFRTLNGMASIVYAILTATGRFDATVFIATVCRHIGEIRAALFGLSWGAPTPTPPDRLPKLQQAALDFSNWVQSGGDPIQARVDAMDEAFQEALTVLGG